MGINSFIGYTGSEGVKTAPGSLIGQVVDEVNPTSGFSYGAAFGYFVTEQTQIGFQVAQQASTLELVGTNSRELTDLKVNNYHGIFTYNLPSVPRLHSLVSSGIAFSGPPVLSGSSGWQGNRPTGHALLRKPIILGKARVAA